jgi:hypothetical protein
MLPAQTQTQPQTSLFNMTEKIPLTIPLSFVQKVQYLCNKISTLEWSGVLFYTTKGDFERPETFSIEVVDILPLDKGTGAFTSYQTDIRFINHLMDNPEKMELKIGHIHSHNTMATFFSGTDISELLDNSPAHNYYLSLITNNNLDFTAKVVAASKEDTSEIEVQKTFKKDCGESFKMAFKKNIEKTYICYDCEILAETPEIKVETWFAEAVEEICKPKVFTSPTYGGQYPSYGKHEYPGYFKKDLDTQKSFDFSSPSSKSKNPMDFKYDKVLTSRKDTFGKDVKVDTPEIETFLMKLFADVFEVELNPDEDDLYTVLMFIEDSYTIQESLPDDVEIAKQILSNFERVAIKTKFNKTYGSVSTLLQSSIEELNSYFLSDYPWLYTTVKVLTNANL